MKVKIQPIEMDESPIHNVVQIELFGTRLAPDLKVYFSSERSEWVIFRKEYADEDCLIFDWVEVATA